jgi:hypothetical protein
MGIGFHVCHAVVHSQRRTSPSPRRLSLEDHDARRVGVGYALSVLRVVRSIIVVLAGILLFGLRGDAHTLEAATGLRFDARAERG